MKAMALRTCLAGFLCVCTHLFAPPTQAGNTPSANHPPETLSLPSLAVHIGRSKGWTVLEGCRLLEHSGNDGDSFHVAHKGREYIFRLYFVDAAETTTNYAERVRDQASYFGIEEDATLALGREASSWVTGALNMSPFTVVTRWEDARGKSKSPRHYGMIITDQGDLDELLVRKGLVRRYGMNINGRQGRLKMERLETLEKQARRSGVGAWAKSPSH